VAGALEADLPSSQTSITLPPPELGPDVAVARSAEPAPADIAAGVLDDTLSSDGIPLDKRVVIDARVPSLHIVGGGVRIPANLVDAQTP